jgi:hypothetical protein
MLAPVTPRTMIEIPSEADILCTADTIFDLIIDFRGQDRWLTRSSAFRGTTAISSNPVTLGTTFQEPGPLGVRRGEVTEFERPTGITFHQPMTLKLGLGTIDVLMRYALDPRAASTHVTRIVTLQIPRHLKLIQPVVKRAFRSESARTLIALKTYADTLA